MPNPNTIHITSTVVISRFFYYFEPGFSNMLLISFITYGLFIFCKDTTFFINMSKRFHTNIDKCSNIRNLSVNLQYVYTL